MEKSYPKTFASFGVFRGQKAYYRTGRRGDLVIASCVFSAKGAISIPAWGDAPGIRLSDKQALKARLSRVDVFHAGVSRAFSAGDFCDAIDPAKPLTSVLSPYPMGEARKVMPSAR